MKRHAWALFGLLIASAPAAASDVWIDQVSAAGRPAASNGRTAAAAVQPQAESALMSSLRGAGGEGIAGGLSLGGYRNEVALTQAGSNNLLNFVQGGTYSTATIDQSGSANRMDLIQAGDRLTMTATQSGSDNVMALQQRGLNNVLSATQSGTGNTMNLVQGGTGNRMVVVQR